MRQCELCDRPIHKHNRTGICQPCKTRIGMGKTPRKATGENYSFAIRHTIQGRIKEYGLHPHCRACAEDCKQWAAPTSEIVFCPRMGEATPESIRRQLEAIR